MGEEGDKSADLLNTILERTAQLEAQRTSSTPKEVLQMMKNTKQMEERQKEYKEWQKEMVEQINDQFDIQTGKMDSLQKT
eukprot:7298658-Ditylum_brightwellii.AAC.1